VGDVLAPVEEAGRVLSGVGLAVVVEVNHAVAAVDFEDGRNHHDEVASNLLYEGRLLDGEAVGQFHEHLRASGLGRVDGAGEPVEGAALVDEAFGLGVRGAARVGEAGGNLLVPVEVLEVGLVADGDE
jgi:hypothetical protein